MMILPGQADGLLRPNPWRYSTTRSCCGRAWLNGHAGNGGVQLRGRAQSTMGGPLTVSDLVTRTSGIAEAGTYRLIEQHTEPCLAIRLTYRGERDAQ